MSSNVPDPLPEWMLHKEEGPARVVDGVEEYWIFGEYVTKEEFAARMPKFKVDDDFRTFRSSNLPSPGNLHRLYGPAKTCTGNCCSPKYFINGEELTSAQFLKRTPKMEVDSNRNVRWRDADGKLHREDGPAFVVNDGRSKCWFKHGKVHRVGGPAIIGSAALLCEKGIWWGDGDMAWVEDGEFHRVDGPAIINSTYGSVWMYQGKPHRVGGPAITRPNGVKEWWEDGNLIRKEVPPRETSMALDAVGVLGRSADTLMVKAKMDVLVGASASVLGVPSEWLPALKLILPVILHRVSPNLRQFAQEALRVSMTEAGFRILLGEAGRIASNPDDAREIFGDVIEVMAREG